MLLGVTKLRFQTTGGLARELETIDSWSQGHPVEALLPPIHRPEDFFSEESARHTILELGSAVGDLGTGLKILDIGAGIGRTSVFLASKGHEVSALEPSGEQCRILDFVAQTLRLPIRIFEGTAEVSDQIAESDFDLCIFNASLHHCDDPILALAGCKTLLKKTGRVILLEEPVLKPFRSKGWYLRRLREDPQSMGHYGGNEHVYYSWEYPRMLRAAGFANVRATPAALLKDLRQSLIAIAKARTQHGYVYSESKLIQHFSWNALMNRLLKRKSLAFMLAKASLIPLNFEGAASGSHRSTAYCPTACSHTKPPSDPA